MGLFSACVFTWVFSGFPNATRNNVEASGTGIAKLLKPIVKPIIYGTIIGGAGAAIDSAVDSAKDENLMKRMKDEIQLLHQGTRNIGRYDNSHTSWLVIVFGGFGTGFSVISMFFLLKFYCLEKSRSRESRMHKV